MQWKQKLIICHSQSEISTNSWKCLACNRFVECLTGSFPFWSLSKFCHSWSCKEAMQRCCFAHLKDSRTKELPTDVVLQGFKVSRLGPMSWSVEWPSVSASRSHLGPKAMSRQNGTKSPVGYQFSHETEVKKETKGLIYSISNLYRNWTESVLVSTWCWPQPSWISLAGRSQTCTLDMHEISGNGEVKSPSTMAFGINSTPPRLQDTQYLYVAFTKHN